MFFKGKHEAARMELRFINKTGNRHFDKPSYIYIDVCVYTYIHIYIYNVSSVCVYIYIYISHVYSWSRVPCSYPTTGGKGDSTMADP